MNEQAMSEPEFRRLAGEIYSRIENRFDDIDPDLAECEVAQGTLTITLASGARWILSQQPPVRQMWLAVASLGKAFHFDYDPANKRWIDSKGEGLELLSHLANLLNQELDADLEAKLQF